MTRIYRWSGEYFGFISREINAPWVKARQKQLEAAVKKAW